MSAQLFTV